MTVFRSRVAASSMLLVLSAGCGGDGAAIADGSDSGAGPESVAKRPTFFAVSGDTTHRAPHSASRACVRSRP